MPILRRSRWMKITDRGDLRRLLLLIRRIVILAVLMLGYVYYRVTAEAGPLAQIGLIAFAAVAQFVPVMIGALFWKGGTKAGAQAGLVLGTAAWAYHLLLPSLADPGWIASDLVPRCPLGAELRWPAALFGRA